MRRRLIRRDLADRGGRGTDWLLAALAGAALGALTAWVLRQEPSAGGPDLVSLQGRVLEVTGDSRVEVRGLGAGIVELVGEVDAPSVATRLVGALTDQPGVETVLDRLWVRPPRLVS